ncbi:DUF3307 domain-containing protein [Seonamhaeicola sediminis]|uniref:DUF3307 domain-containing protein n=1 Tax=Seonamhaeicola sediminis TaxID=2528206 RepID=A0A562YBS6_9FLAO|nr:DUF3307 domain-containing protein [Seonamhaeicola sediminis]TWO31873.1 DUF3307 domain-containing protein [Seonamhaeicola sediminis]
MMLFLKLFLAHIIGDFFLQPTKWVKENEKKKLKSPKLYIHVVIHIILVTLILWDKSLWPIFAVIGITHLAIDAMKLSFQKKKSKRLWFFIDQLSHIVVIAICYYIFSENTSTIKIEFTENSILLVTCLLFLTIPVSIIMKTIFLKWNISELTKNNESLEDAGKYIGILERILVFIFIVLGHWEAVGFLITAKSVFRFGDLRESKDRQLTEYILIGTLISFGIAIITGILYNLLV